MSCGQRHPSVTRWSGILLLTLLAGCDRGQIQEYQVAKEQTPTPGQAQPAVLPPGHPDTSGAGAPKLQYTVPADWQEAPPGPMRAASFRVAGKDGKQADVSVIPLPGLAGSDLDNVNRWRGQVGLPAVSEPELAKLAQAVEVAGQPANLYEQAGTNAGSGDSSRILAAIQRRDGVAWFFKMTGDDALVAQQKPAFVNFLKSVGFPAGMAQGQLPPAHPPIDGGQPSLPPDHPPIGASSTAQSSATAPSVGAAKPGWEVPTGWKEVPGGQFLVAKFAVGGATNTQTSVNVSMSTGDGGGLLANVNRWRNQLSLGPLAEADLAKEIQPLDLPAGKASLADITGPNASDGQQTRLLAVVVPRPGETWFYKLMGSAPVVQQEKDAFMKFVQSVKY